VVGLARRSVIPNRAIIIVLIVLLLIVSLATPAYAALSWSVQIVDTNTVAIGNGYVPIVVDSNNIPHIGYSGSYNSHTGKRGGYATLNGSGWITQEIPDGWVTDLKLDANNNPHMLLDRGTYARWTGTEWATQTFSTEQVHYASLALDSSGNPHAAYVDSEGLKYASLPGSNWSIQTVDSSFSERGFQLSLVLNKNKVPYILYAAPSTYEYGGVEYNSVSVKLAVLKDSEWSIEPVLASYNLYHCWNMILDSDGYPRFLAALLQPSTFLYTILYTSWDGTVWNTQKVVSDVSGANLNAFRGFLALDAHDNPNIVYEDGDNELMYAIWTGADWNIQTIEISTPTVIWTGTEWSIQNGTKMPILTIDGPCYLAIDTKGSPHISFRGVIYDQPHWQAASVLYATATGTSDFTQPPTNQASSITATVLPFLLVATAGIIVVITATVYVWKRKTWRHRQARP
jgi:hypothetical protein